MGLPSPAADVFVLRSRSTGPESLAAYVHAWSLRKPVVSDWSVPTTLTKTVACDGTLTLYAFVNVPRLTRAQTSRTVALPERRPIWLQLTLMVAAAALRLVRATARAPDPASGL